MRVTKDSILEWSFLGDPSVLRISVLSHSKHVKLHTGFNACERREKDTFFQQQNINLKTDCA